MAGQDVDDMSWPSLKTLLARATEKAAAEGTGITPAMRDINKRIADAEIAEHQHDNRLGAVPEAIRKDWTREPNEVQPYRAPRDRNTPSGDFKSVQP